MLGDCLESSGKCLVQDSCSQWRCLIAPKGMIVDVEESLDSLGCSCQAHEGVKYSEPCFPNLEGETVVEQTLNAGEESAAGYGQQTGGHDRPEGDQHTAVTCLQASSPCFKSLALLSKCHNDLRPVQPLLNLAMVCFSSQLCHHMACSVDTTVLLTAVLYSAKNQHCMHDQHL